MQLERMREYIKIHKIHLQIHLLLGVHLGSQPSSVHTVKFYCFTVVREKMCFYHSVCSFVERCMLVLIYFCSVAENKYWLVFVVISAHRSKFVLLLRENLYCICICIFICVSIFVLLRIRSVRQSKFVLLLREESNQTSANLSNAQQPEICNNVGFDKEKYWYWCLKACLKGLLWQSWRWGGSLKGVASWFKSERKLDGSNWMWGKA